MSLQVWLPLNGNLNNQGLSDIAVTNTGAVIDSAGKIGSCYSFGTSASNITFTPDVLKNNTETSCCFWLNITSWNTSWATFFQFGLGTAPWASYIFGLLRNNTTSKLCFTISDGTTSTTSNC